MIKIGRFILPALLLSVAIVLFWTASVSAQTDRAKQVGMKLKCMCRGCEMSAGGCSHPGGAFSGPCETAKSMLKEVDRHIANAETDEQIMQAFVKEYGSVVFMQPPKSGFGLVAWLMPVACAILGVALLAFVIKKWLKSQPIASSHGPNNLHASPEALQRARLQADRETEDG